MTAMERAVLVATLVIGLVGTAGAEALTAGDVVLELPLGLQASSAYIPDDNAPTPDRVALGRLLYFDQRLSGDGTISCATCHDPQHGFAEPRKTSTGIGGQLGGRNAPTVINRLFSAEQFWDGRAVDLEAQALGPLVNPIEMGMTSHAVVADVVRGIAGYAPLFETAFGSSIVTIERIGQAIASYERTVWSGNSPYDRHQAGEVGAMSEAARRGLVLFGGKANCVTCHAGFNFTDESYHNLGVGMAATTPDLGRHDVTKADADRGAFKTPTLREIAHSGPYMHDGSLATLMEVVELYDRGGEKNPWLAKEMRPLGLTAEEKRDLVAFLEALSGEVSGTERPAAFPK
jgi:cytochrome c peroxidase